jgi:hypothetical protein
LRIAIAGTHCSGKSTLIDAFLVAHPDYRYEPEPYEALQDRGEVFASEPDADDFYRQLEYSIERLEAYRPGDRVIFERSPLDFVAYLLALDDLSRFTANRLLSDRSIEKVRESISLLDVIVFLPIDGSGIIVPDEEDAQLRTAMSEQLEQILIDDDFCLFSNKRPVVIELRGATVERVRLLESALSRID